MHLNAEERIRFAEYCKQQANDCNLVAEQLSKTLVHASADQLASREKMKAKAYLIVAMDLRLVAEHNSVRPEDKGVVTLDEPS